MKKENNMNDVNWNVDFKVTFNGIKMNFDKLPEFVRKIILNFIADDCYSGTFGCRK